MSKPPALAPTIELAEPRIERYAQRIANELDLKTHQFYACEPCEHLIESGYGENKERWIEGFWALELVGNEFSPRDLPHKESIDIEVLGVELRPVGMVVSLLLTARVLR